MSRSKRLSANIALFGSVLFLPFMPWYVPFVAGAIIAWYAPYYELILLGFILDLTYASGYFFYPFGTSFPLPFTCLAGLILIILHVIKKRVRFYA